MSAHRGVSLALLAIGGVAFGVLAARAFAAHRSESPSLVSSMAAAAAAGGPSVEDGAPVAEAPVKVADLKAEHPDYIFDIPSLDLAGLSSSQQEEVIRLLNEKRCNCNCNMTLAKCRLDDRSCPRSPEIVARFLSLIRQGTAPDEAAKQMYGAQGPQAAQPSPGAAPLAANGKTIVYKVEAGDSPSRGPADAPVTLIEFLDFQCPFCGRAEQTVEQIMREYEGKVRLVYKQHPLVSIHPQAMLAAQAALAAHEQGRYHEMHQKLFSISRSLTRESILNAAREIGLDISKFTTALDSEKHKSVIESESQQAASLGATGTPAFFINGRYLNGARPFEQFKAILDQEVAGQRGEFVWGTNVRTDQPSPVPTAQAPPEDPNKIYEVDLKGAASRGPEDAPVTIVEFTDYQCPFCKRVQPTLAQLFVDYPDKVRLVTKNLPLAFHGDARGAARAALAAHRQGKYWEFRDLLFDNSRALSEDKLVSYAEQLDLDLDRFRKDMGSAEIEQRISDDLKQAQEIGATGTPTFLINGRKLVGAQPLSAFKQHIDAELTRSGK